MKLNIQDSKRFEIIGICLTVIGKFIFMDWLNYRLPFVAIAIIFWASYIFLKTRNNKKQLYDWGFRTDNFKDILKKVLPLGIFSVVVFPILGWYLGTLNITWHIIPILITYPIWGTIQQFLIMGLFAGNMQDFQDKKLSDKSVIILTAILFSSVHYPDKWLMFGTFILAIYYSFIYLKQRNLYVLGIFHGWLGALFYYTIVNRDPFLESFGNLLINHP